METQLSQNMEKLQKLISTRMDEYEEKLLKATVGPATSPPDLSSLSHDFTNFKTFVWQTLSTMKAQIELLTLGLDRHENAMRRKVLLLHGVPEKQNEKVSDVAMNLIRDKLKVTDLTAEHLQVCHRLGSSQVKTRPILIRFDSMEPRHLVWDSKTALKGTGITATEFLTKARHQVFMRARSHFGVKQCWTTEGKITILLPNKSRRKVESVGDLEKLISQLPANREAVGLCKESSQKPKASKNESNASTKRDRR